jgi:outer membrane lipoprotein-sorting protein
MNSKVISTAILTVFTVACLCIDSHAQDARTIVKEGFNYMRGKSSFSVVDMTIHRPDWERKMTIEAWTKGHKNSLFRIIAPAKDKDNGTLKRGREMWMYNPKVNRVIKLPPSMMSQAWMQPGRFWMKTQTGTASCLLLQIWITPGYGGKRIFTGSWSFILMA